MTVYLWLYLLIHQWAKNIFTNNTIIHIDHTLSIQTVWPRFRGYIQALGTILGRISLHNKTDKQRSHTYKIATLQLIEITSALSNSFFCVSILLNCFISQTWKFKPSKLTDIALVWLSNSLPKSTLSMSTIVLLTVNIVTLQTCWKASETMQ